MKAKLISSPRRLFMNLAILGLMLTALAFAPTQRTVSADGCEMGCVAWSQQCGCYKLSYCCTGYGTYWCSYATNPDCHSELD